MRSGSRKLDMFDKYSLMDYLFEVQDGKVPCRRAATEIQKQIPNQIWVITLYTPLEVILERLGLTEKDIYKDDMRKKLLNLSKELGIRVGLTGLDTPHRPVGYFFTKEEAFEAVYKSGEGYNEMGYYVYAIIENFFPSSECDNWPKDIDKKYERYFFKFNDEDGNYHLLEEEPDWAKQTVNYGLG